MIATDLSSRGALDSESCQRRPRSRFGRPRGNGSGGRASNPLCIASHIKLFSEVPDAYENYGRNDKTVGKTKDLEKREDYQVFCRDPSKMAKLSEWRLFW